MSVPIHTVAFEGVAATKVEVQVHLSPGLPAFMIVGLPDKAVGESKERVRAAIHSLGISIPAKRIIVNLAPADLAKEGSHFDLPIAIALLVAIGVLPASEMERYYALGELSLDGRILPVAGVLPAAIEATAVSKGVICPESCGSEAAWTGNKDILAPSSLLALINHFKGTQVLTYPSPIVVDTPCAVKDMREVRGQYTARRALEVAAAGAHNMLMVGPPGAGKSLLASCLPGILPNMDVKEMLEISMIQSVAGKLAGGSISRVRPFRDPHHSSSLAAMVGGGRRAVPGEISLAHCGVLFLDELPEFPRSILESLRQPLETGTISVARVQAHVTYPANVQLIAAMNPCRCGYIGDASRACSKAPRCGAEYQSRLSGPLLDRIDIHIEVPAVDTLDMMSASAGESSEVIAARVAAARFVQKERYRELESVRTNADVSVEQLQQLAEPDMEGKALLEEATAKMKLSMRGYTRVLRVARTIADLAGSAQVKRLHVAEALSYRHTQSAPFSDAL